MWDERKQNFSVHSADNVCTKILALKTRLYGGFFAFRYKKLTDRNIGQFYFYKYEITVVIGSVKVRLKFNSFRLNLC